MLPNLQVKAEVIATRGTTSSLSFLICDPVSSGHCRVSGRSSQDSRWKVASSGLGTEEGLRKGSSLSFPAPPWESAKCQVKDPLGLLWPPHWRMSRKGVGCSGVEQVSFFLLCDPAIRKQTPCVLCCFPAQPAHGRPSQNKGRI